MKALNMSLIAATATLMLVTGCATDDPNRRAKAGAALGVVAGGVIGHQINDKNGRYAGAVVGALTGAAVGNYMDKQQRQLEQSLAEELQNAEPARLRELIRRMVARIDLWFDHVPKGNRVECPLSRGMIELRPDQISYRLVSRGDPLFTEQNISVAEAEWRVA